MSKYDVFTTYLTNQPDKKEKLFFSFGDIERILGDSLPQQQELTALGGRILYEATMVQNG